MTTVNPVQLVKKPYAWVLDPEKRSWCTGVEEIIRALLDRTGGPAVDKFESIAEDIQQLSDAFEQYKVSNDSEIASLQSTIDTNTAAIDQNTDSITSNTSRITALENAVTVVEVDANYTAEKGQILICTNGASINVDPPATPANGDTIKIKRRNAEVVFTGQTDGAASYTLTTLYDAVTLVYFDAEWSVL